MYNMLKGFESVGRNMCLLAKKDIKYNIRKLLFLQGY